MAREERKDEGVRRYEGRDDRKPKLTEERERRQRLWRLDIFKYDENQRFGSQWTIRAEIWSTIALSHNRPINLFTEQEHGGVSRLRGEERKAMSMDVNLKTMGTPCFGWTVDRKEVGQHHNFKTQANKRRCNEHPRTRMRQGS